MVAGGGVRVTDIASDHPRSKLVWQFPGSFCGVPSIVSHYLIQSVPILHAIVVVDIKDGAHPVEVGRTVIDPALFPHWTGYDARTQRLAVTGAGKDRLFMLKFDAETGALADSAFTTTLANPDSISTIAPGRTAGPARRLRTGLCFRGDRSVAMTG